MSENNSKKARQKLATKTLVILALLSAISIILSRFCVIYFTDQLRLSFGNIPILIAGLLFGPIAGAMVGGITDIIGAAMLSGFGWYPPLTLTPILMGFIAGILRNFVMRNTKFYRVAITTLIANAIGTMIWSTLSLSWLYGTPFWVQATYRVPFYIGVAVLEAFVLFAVLKSGAFKSALRDKR